MADDRWLVVGLANPDDRYAGTRHNVGAACVELLADRLGVRPGRHRSGALLVDTVSPATRTPLTLGRPGGYMNTSGGPTRRAMDFYSLDVSRLVVVHDDLDLELGVVRLKRGGGSGGHNGLRDVTRACGGPGYVRVRLGVGRPPGRQDPADYVLRRFGRRDADEVALMVERGADAVLAVVDDGLEAAQNRVHAPA